MSDLSDDPVYRIEVVLDMILDELKAIRKLIEIPCETATKRIVLDKDLADAINSFDPFRLKERK